MEVSELVDDLYEHAKINAERLVKVYNINHLKEEAFKEGYMHGFLHGGKDVLQRVFHSGSYKIVTGGSE